MPAASYSPPRTIVDLDSAGEMLRAAGHRLSASRRGVIEALLRAEGPVSAEHIASGLGGLSERLDLPSTYRNLELLERLGAVHHVHVGHGPGLYALVGRSARAYVVCEGCGRLARLGADDVDAIRREVRRATGFEAHFSHFPVVGLCRGCAHGEAGGAAAHEHEHEHAHGDRIHSHPHAHGGGRGGAHVHEHD